MTTRAKLAIVSAGYAGAFLIASAAFSLRLSHTNTADARAASGMYAFGDALTFIGVFFIAALPATGAALFFLRANREFWTAVAAISLAIASTGIVALAVYIFARATGLAALTPLRMLAAPLFALGFFMSAFFAPSRGARVALLTAAACEAAVTAYIGVFWFGRIIH